jgi:hypothetical protein
MVGMDLRPAPTPCLVRAHIVIDHALDKVIELLKSHLFSSCFDLLHSSFGDVSMTFDSPRYPSHGFEMCTYRVVEI